MTSFTPNDLRRAMAKLRWPWRMTWAGMLAEQAVRAFWPLVTICLLVLAALMLGAQDMLPIEGVWAIAAVTAIATLWALVFAAMRFRIPSWSAALARLDESLPGRPIQAMLDDPAIGDMDDASMAVWRAHKTRMAQRAGTARAVPGDLRVSAADPYALRYVAVLAFAVALIFGALGRVSSVADMTPGAAGLAEGPVWEGWAEPPRYTGKPTLYLNDLPQGDLDLPAGTLITVRFYGEAGALQLVEDVSGRSPDPAADPEAAPKTALDFTVITAGQITINGPGGRSWDVAMLADLPPQVERLGEPEVSALGEMRLPFGAGDDYGVEVGEARIALNLTAVDRRYGLTVDPDPREDIVVPLPTPIAGDRSAFEENLIENFSQHPWANLPVTLSLTVLDAAEQSGTSGTSELILPGRRFFDPTAAAVIEMRRDLMWSTSNAPRMAQVLRAVSYKPEDAFRSQTTALRLRDVVKRLEIHARYGLREDTQQKLVDDMWDLAIELEEGVLADALERMRRAQDRLNEAIKNGASKEEIAELMDELRRATEDYLQQLQREQQQQAERDGTDQPQQPQGESMQMTQDDLQRMMDRIQELMEQGRMAEAEQALQELQEMMENMQVTQGQQGQGGQSAGEQAMEGLAETLRDQQGLSDQAFRDLQEQFNPGAQAGESQGNEGRNGGQGQGESHEGSNGQGEGAGEQQEGQSGDRDAQNGGTERGLAERQQALRDELRRQQGQLPGQGTPEGDAAREALDRAGRAMDNAEQSLREGDLAEAIDNQSQAMDALREGMQSLGEAMAQEQQQRQAGQGTADSDRRATRRDPLNRELDDNNSANNDSLSTGGRLAQGPGDGAGRARQLLDEIRRRSSETGRNEVEREYLKRLLDRF